VTSSLPLAAPAPGFEISDMPGPGIPLALTGEIRPKVAALRQVFPGPRDRRILVEKQVVHASFAELERGNAASPCDASTLHSTW